MRRGVGSDRFAGGSWLSSFLGIIVLLIFFVVVVGAISTVFGRNDFSMVTSAVFGRSDFSLQALLPPRLIGPAPAAPVTDPVTRLAPTKLAALDWDIPEGRFFTQTNGEPSGTSPTGFAVTNRDGMSFWDEYRRLGGPYALGLPLSDRFQWKGQTTQVFQRAVFRWDPAARQVSLANVLDELSAAGKDTWLAEYHGVPRPLPADFDAGKSWEQIVASRVALFEGSRALKDKYSGVADPLKVYGLPTSQVTDMGTHVAIRLQRTVFYHWRVNVAWANAGDVTVLDVGQVAIQADLFPKEALRRVQAPLAPVVPSAPPATVPTPGNGAAGVPPGPGSGPAAAAKPAALEWDIPDGHFFTQTNGEAPGASATGFAVTNRDGMPFWDEYRRLGGTTVLGFPLSDRVQWQGRATQVFQRAVFRWEASSGKVSLANVLDDLGAAGKNAWLFENHGVPRPLPGSFDGSKNWDQILAARLALLDENRAFKAKYFSVADPLKLYGLPTSRVTDMGAHLAIRLQRAVFRLPKANAAQANAGDVVLLDVGQIAVQAGLFPQEVLHPVSAPFVPTAGGSLAPNPYGSTPGLAPTQRTPGAAPAPQAPATAGPASPQPGPTTTPGGPHRAMIGNTGGDGAYLRRTPNPSDKLRAWPDTTVVEVLGGEFVENGLPWVQVKDPAGNVGYLPAQYVVGE